MLVALLKNNSWQSWTRSKWARDNSSRERTTTASAPCKTTTTSAPASAWSRLCSCAGLWSSYAHRMKENSRGRLGFFVIDRASGSTPG